MRALGLSVLLLALAPLGAAQACSPGRTATPGPLERGAQCTLVQPLQIGQAFAEAAMDLGNGRVAQVYGHDNGCDLYSAVVVTECSSGQRLTIGPDESLGQPNGGGQLFDIKSSLAPAGGLDLTARLPDLAAEAARQGQDVAWLNVAWRTIPEVYADWADLTCACATFYPGSEGAR